MTARAPEFLSAALSRGCPTISLDAGEKVFLKGEDGERMFAVVSGRVELLLFGRVLESVGPGGIFGEMALLEDAERSAAALAAEPSTVAAIDKAAFLSIIAAEPELALGILKVMAGRIRRANAGL